MGRPTGMQGSPSMKLLTPSVPPEELLGSDGPAETADAESRGEDTPEPTATKRPKNKKKGGKQSVEGETKKCGLYLTLDVLERLHQTALQRRKTISLVANELLAANLPKWEVKRKVS